MGAEGLGGSDQLLFGTGMALHYEALVCLHNRNCSCISMAVSIAEFLMQLLIKKKNKPQEKHISILPPFLNGNVY